MGEIWKIFLVHLMLPVITPGVGGACPPSTASALCPEKFPVIFDSRCYYIATNSDAAPYDQARQFCVSRGGDLPRVYNFAARDAFYNFFNCLTGESKVWVGLTNHKADKNNAQFQWFLGDQAFMTDYNNKVQSNDYEYLYCKSFVDSNYLHCHRSDDSQFTSDRRFVCEQNTLLPITTATPISTTTTTSTTPSTTAVQQITTTTAHESTSSLEVTTTMDPDKTSTDPDTTTTSVATPTTTSVTTPTTTSPKTTTSIAQTTTTSLPEMTASSSEATAEQEPPTTTQLSTTAAAPTLLPQSVNDSLGYCASLQQTFKSTSLSFDKVENTCQTYRTGPIRQNITELLYAVKEETAYVSSVKAKDLCMHSCNLMDRCMSAILLYEGDGGDDGCCLLSEMPMDSTLDQSKLATSRINGWVGIKVK